MSWIIVFATKKQSDVKKIDKRSLIFLILSGMQLAHHGFAIIRLYKMD